MISITDRFEASGTCIAYATAPGSTASDNKSGQNGLYTQERLKAMRQPGLRIEVAGIKAKAQ